MLKQKLITNYKQKRSLFLILIFFTTIIYGVVSYAIYNNSKTIIYEKIDKELKNAALTVDFLLPNNFHDRARNVLSIPEEEDRMNVSILSDYAYKVKIKYIYSMIKIADKVYFTSSSATPEDFQKNMVSNYFELYKSASQELLNAFDNDDIVYEESTDKWGTFRSVFIPMKSLMGNKYILGADIDITQINEELNKILIRSASFLIIALLTILGVFFVKNRIELKEVVKRSLNLGSLFYEIPYNRYFSL